MSISKLKSKSLVLYKERPAVVTQWDSKKLEIDPGNGRKLRVRPKDVTLLHPGPLQNLTTLTSVDGDVETAWELLAGEETALPELAELAFDAFTPQTAWAAWQLVADGLYFSGTPELIQVHTEEQVAEIQSKRDAKSAEALAWEQFLDRMRAGEFAAEDGRFLQDVVAVAQGTHEKSQVLRALGKKETPEKAHALLLKCGYWDQSNNPYPSRAGLSMKSAAGDLPALPDEERRDLTHLTALAIDDAGNQDPDDAISLENGRLWVHIADVAALITPDSLADLEARARGANLYLPEGTVHMLPPAATQILALGLNPISPALSFNLELSAAGEVELVEVVPSWVKVTRLSYQEAEEQLESSPLREMGAMAQIYAQRRAKNGAIDIDLPEIKIRVDAEGKVTIRPLLQLQSRSLVRDAMLMTGEAVGRYALVNQIPIPYTVQDPPTEPMPPAATLSEHFALRRTMQPSRQGSTPGIHAGLGMDVYVQTTSPLRRYLDLVAHQQLRAHLKGEPLLDSQELMDRVGAAAALSGDVRWAERQSVRHWTLVYLTQNPDWLGEGVIIDRRGRRDSVLIPELDLETRMPQKGKRPLDSKLTLKFNKVDLVQQDAFFQEVKD
ncbi:MAG: RNB domain-containing ribonuclease [Anaerolineales bacterium]|nr:RNB domain-containing ribonuclease [Anaerolineales bacterium]